MLNLEVSINLNVELPDVGRAALTVDLSGNRRATGMIKFYMPATIDLKQIGTGQKCRVMQYRRHPIGVALPFCLPGRKH